MPNGKRAAESGGLERSMLSQRFHIIPGDVPADAAARLGRFIFDRAALDAALPARVA